MIIPVLPEMIAAANKRFKGEQKQRVNTLASGLFNASLGVGQTVGPIIGALLYEYFGFRETQDMIACFCICYGLLYFICAGGWSAFKSTLMMKDEVEPHVRMDEMKLGEGKSKYCGNSMRSRSSIKG